MQCSAALGMVGRVGRVARVNAGRMAVATGDREAYSAHTGVVLLQLLGKVLWVGFLSKYSGMSRVEVGV